MIDLARFRKYARGEGPPLKSGEFIAIADEVDRLGALLTQIKTVCDDNASVPLQGRAMALQFVRDIAATIEQSQERKP